LTGTKWSSAVLLMSQAPSTTANYVLSLHDALPISFLIVSGSVEVTIGEGTKAKFVGTLDAGDVFGEMSLIDPGPRSATVKAVTEDRMSTRLNSSHLVISYAVFCLKKTTRRMLLACL